MLSALIGNGIPSGTAISHALTGLPLIRASIGDYAFVPALSSPDPDDCGSLDTEEIQNNDNLQLVRTPANSSDGERVCVLHFPLSDAPRFCPYARMTRESHRAEPWQKWTMFRPFHRCTAAMTKASNASWRVRASSARFDRGQRYPLSGVKRTCQVSESMSASDPKRAHMAPRCPNYIVHCCCPDEERSFDYFHSHEVDPSSRHNQGGVFDLWRHDRSGWAIQGPYCDGWPINDVVGDPETGTLWAGGGGEWHGAGMT